MNQDMGMSMSTTERKEWSDYMPIKAPCIPSNERTVANEK